MATTISGTAVADPAVGYDGVEITELDFGAMHDQADGSTVIDYITTKDRFSVRWVGLTAAELMTLEGALVRGTNLELTLPHMGAHKHVFVVPSSFKKSYIEGSAAARWKCEVQFIEVS